MFVLARTGVFYNEFLATYGLRLGVSLEILVFSFALSYRIHEERQAKAWAQSKISEERAQRIDAQELALAREVEVRQAREQALQLEISHRESLQQLVNERTADLEKTLLDLERANQELEHLSSRDALTGLYNRRHFDNRLAELWQELARRGHTLSILLLDVDHFKQINDSKGHPCGDMVLKELARLLGTVLHRPSDIIARYGGEEFVVLLPETPMEGALHIAQMIVQVAAEKVYLWEGQQLRATVSVGVNCLVPGPGSNANQLLQGADVALYQAKRTGRNRYAQFDDSDPSLQQSG
jgi:diguanylate cyclase (GGDEF)-like protein